MEREIGLGDRELDVMAVLWSAGSGTVAEVKENLSAPLAYTTVLTILRNLEAKGVIGHALEGKSHRFVPLLKEQDARRTAVSRVMEKFFSGSAEELVLHLVRDRALSRKDLKKIRRVVRSKDESNDDKQRAPPRDTIPVYRQERNSPVTEPAPPPMPEE